MTRWSQSATFLSAMMVLVVLSAGLNVLQAQRIRALVSAESSTPSVIGQTAPAVSGYAVSGDPREVSLRADIPSVVYFFEPGCEWCDRNWRNIETLAASASGRFRVLAVSRVRGVRPYLEARHLTVDVVEGISENVRQSLGLYGAPATIAVSAEGLITHVWRGAFTPRSQRQIEELFGVVLPGLPQTAIDHPVAPW